MIRPSCFHIVQLNLFNVVEDNRKVLQTWPGSVGIPQVDAFAS